MASRVIERLPHPRPQTLESPEEPSRFPLAAVLFCALRNLQQNAQSGDVTIPWIAATRSRKGSLSPALALSKRRLAICVLLVRDLSSGRRDSHVSSSTFCRSLIVSGGNASTMHSPDEQPNHAIDKTGNSKGRNDPEISKRNQCMISQEMQSVSAQAYLFDCCHEPGRLQKGCRSFRADQNCCFEIE